VTSAAVLSGVSSTSRNINAMAAASSAGCAASSRVAVLAETEAARDAVVAALRDRGVQAVDWPTAEPPAALVLAVETSDPPRAWLYEAGAAVGAVGRRAVVAPLGDAPAPPELADLVTVEVGPELSAALREALAKLGSG